MRNSPHLRYFAYCRKSTDEKDKQILSIPQQIDELKEFASRENLQIIETFTEAKTAKEPGRAIFNNLLKLVKKGFADGIITWHPDRLARNSIDGGKIIYLLDTGQLQDLKFPTFWFQNTPQGKFMLNIAFGQSKYYVDNLSENVKRGLHFKAKRGEWPGYAPFGYKNDRNTRTLVLEPNESKLVKIVFRDSASGKFNTMKEIRDYLFRCSVKLKDGKPLHYNQIRKMLTRNFYHGVFAYGGISYEAKHPPLITKDLFDRVQVRLNSIYNTQPKKHKFDFTGLLKCKECGCAITAETHKKYYKETKRVANYVYYRCTKKVKDCSQPYISEKDCELQLREIVWKSGLSHSWHQGFCDLLKKDVIEAKGNISSELSSLTISLQAVEKKLNRLLELYLDESINSEDYQLKKDQLLQKKLQLKSNIEKVRREGSSWLEPLREFIDEAANAARIARGKENGKELKFFAQKVGSNYLLNEKRISFCPNIPYSSFAARPIAACDIPTTLLLCRRRESNPHEVLPSQVFETCASAIPPPRLIEPASIIAKFGGIHILRM